MKFKFLTVALLLSVISAYADSVTREQAQRQAQLFLERQNTPCMLSPVTDVQQFSSRGRRAAVQNNEFYIFNKGVNEGFIIVSGDDQTEPILGYSDQGRFDYKQLPPAMRALLDDYASQIAQIRKSGGGPAIRDAVPTHSAVIPLMTSKWSQGYPYNLSCPEYFSLGRSVTGCVATAMAQILYYHREKSVSETTAAMPSYETWTSHPTYGKLKVEGVPEGSPIDWENMKDEYGSATEKQRKAVADLMHYCGVAVSMDYTNSSSGAQSQDAYQAFGRYFGYGQSVRYINNQTVSSDTEWDKIIYNELAAGRPVYVSGSNEEGGHAFVADGYDGNLRYHINWGWGGTSDGYYLLTNLTPGQQGIGGSSAGYNAYREIIIGIEPENYAEKSMSFADATVKALCLEHWDADGDGQITYGEAAAVDDLGTVFRGSNIKTFKELYYFTGLVTLPDDAFNGCQRLTTLRLPKNINSIGHRSLKDCQKLSKLEMPNHVKTIGAEAFSGCSSLTELALPDELPAISVGLFSGCAALTSMTLPVSVTAIGDEAFAGCTRLAEFTVKSYSVSDISLAATAFKDVDLSKAKLYCLQGTKSFFSTAEGWRDFGTIDEKRERSAGQFAQLEAGKKYYLYHVGTGQYLTKGEAWGTQAVVGDEPMRFVINRNSRMPEGTYYLTSEDTGRSGRYLFRTTSDANVGNGVTAAFVDGANLTTNSYWTIEAVGDNVYTFRIPTNGVGYEAGKYWGVHTDHASNAASPTYGVYADVDYADHKPGCQWRLVLYDEAVAAQFEAALTLGNLLSIANGRRLQTASEQAVYDALDSGYDTLRMAQRSLRKKLKFIDFADDGVRTSFISVWDIDSDGELSFQEAEKANDFNLYFQGNTSLTSMDELRYFTNVSDIYGSTFDGCRNLESIILPEGIVHIYYYAFRNCKKLTSINIPEFVTTLGDGCFYGCSSLQSVSVDNPVPSAISLGSNVFGGVPLSSCTLYVPYGAKSLYEKVPVWKNFGTIVEVRTHIQPAFSAIEADVPGYLINLSTRKYLGMGEAYGTQSVVGRNGMIYQFKRSKTMADGIYYLYSDQTGKDGKVLFRTSIDAKVGTGVKTCFGDGSLSDKAYWKVTSVGDNVYTLQVPETDVDYVANEYLGTDEGHASSAASPTYGLYWDVKGEGCKWAFVTVEDMKAAKDIDERADFLALMLERAVEAGIDVRAEQAVYDTASSTIANLNSAIVSVRSKLHYITFDDSRVQTLCTALWDTDGDGELTFEEAAAVTDLGEFFRGATTIKSFDELRYFTSLTELPSNAFRGASSLQRLYVPAGVKSLGDYVFTGCSVLKSIVLLGESHKLSMGYAGVQSGTTLFVPASMLETYQSDDVWSSRCTVVEYTGKPVVTATATRGYGRVSAAIKVQVTGAPIEGAPDCSCSAIGDRRAPVGEYPIVVAPGTVSTQGVEFFDGVFTVTPATLTVTAQSYTRKEGESNPVFEFTCNGFRNRETDTVFTVRPVITCDALPSSPAGEYAIMIGGAQARNYVMEYIPGTLTVVADPTAIHTTPSASDEHLPVYDLQGRRIQNPCRGVYIQGRRKVVK